MMLGIEQREEVGYRGTLVYTSTSPRYILLIKGKFAFRDDDLTTSWHHLTLSVALCGR